MDTQMFFTDEQTRTQRKLACVIAQCGPLLLTEQRADGSSVFVHEWSAQALTTKRLE